MESVYLYRLTFFHSPKFMRDEEREEEGEREEEEEGIICFKSMRRIPTQGREGGLAP